jgi:putative ABC transport system permease protein
MDKLLQDLRYAARRLASSPGFAAAALLTLALGIGANSAIFSVVDGVLLRPLPFREPDRLVRLYTHGAGAPPSEISAPDFMSLREQSGVFTDVAAYTESNATLTGTGEPESLKGLWVSAGFFRVLGVSPVLGRGFVPDANLPGHAREVVLSYGTWRDRFGSDARVLGRTLMLNGVQRTVVGVMPEGFAYPSDRQLWIPIPYDSSFSASASTNRRAEYLDAVGRLKPGVSLARAQSAVATVAARLRREYPETNTGVEATVLGLHEATVGDVRMPLLVLLGAVGFVLLIACVNVANLLLARMAARESEIAVRAALGAGRGALVRQLLTENLLLGVLGGTLGLLLAHWGVAALVSLRPQDIPRLDAVGLDGRAVAFTGAVSLLTSVLVGIFPALKATRPDLAASLREGGRGGGAGRAATRLRGTLVVAEVAMAVVLLAGAGLLIRSFVQLQRVDPGFRPDGVVSFDLTLPRAAYPEDAQVGAFHAALLGRIREMPGVKSAGAVSAIPMGGSKTNITFDVVGRAPAKQGEEPSMDVRLATADYVRTMGIPVLRGRAFDTRDRAGSAPVVLLNQAAARRFFAGEDPLGRRIELGWTRDGVAVGGEVVGVVGDVREDALEHGAEPEIYIAAAQVPPPSMNVVVRAAGDPAALAPALRREVRAMDANLPLRSLRTVDRVLAESVARPRFYMLLLAVFAGVALLLAAIGIFGVMAYSVSQRTREIGIRMALGAEPRAVLRNVVGGAMSLVGVGLGVGILAAFAVTRILQGLLFEVTPADPVTYLAVSTTLAAVALGAGYLPARTATRVDPMVTLRHE